MTFTRISTLCMLTCFAASGCCYFPKAFSPERIYLPNDCGECAEAGEPGFPCSVCGTPDCAATHPFRFLKRKATCGAGCGELYWGDWISDPPDDCDPCDGYGRFVGENPCCVRWWDRFWMGLAGHRFGCGCGTCAGAPGGSYAGEIAVEGGEYWEDEIPLEGFDLHSTGEDWEVLPEAAPPAPPKAARRGIRAPYAKTNQAHWRP